MSNDFLPFATGGGANVISQATYAANPVVGTGFQTGLADSRYLNKVWRQSAFIASCLAQYIANTLGVSVVDNGNVSTMLGYLASVLGNLPGTVVDSIPFQSAAGVTSYISAPTSSGQVLQWTGSAFAWIAGGGGDVVHWDTPATGSGYLIGGNGINRQWVTQFVAGAGAGPVVTVPYPSGTAFATEAILESIVVIDPSRAGVASPSDALLFGAVTVGLTSCDVYLGQNGGGTRDVTIVVTLKGK